MKCEKCGKDYPSKYYFKTENVCFECFGKMSQEEQTKCSYRALMKYPMTTTTFGIEGYRITKQIGANAVIGIRYDANDIMDGVTEVLCYGTAVIVEPISNHTV